MKLIPLHGKSGAGKFTTVDDEDFDRLKDFKWYYGKGGYAFTDGNHPSGGSTLMHRILLGDPEGLEVDHLDLDKLNNQKWNLRACTHQQNRCNTPVQKRNKCGFKGVTKYMTKKGLRFTAQITNRGRKRHIGAYDTPEEAHEAYKVEAIKEFGEFARW